MVSSLIARRWVRPKTQWRLYRLVGVWWLAVAGPNVVQLAFFSSDYLWVVSPFLFFIIVSLFDYIVSLCWYITIVRNPSCALLCFHSSFTNIFMSKRELVALLCLSSWCLVILCGSSSRCHGFVCSLWLWYFLIILTIYCSPNSFITTCTRGTRKHAVALHS